MRLIAVMAPGGGAWTPDHAYLTARSIASFRKIIPTGVADSLMPLSLRGGEELTSYSFHSRIQ